jgi:endonuclease YncB( thermonuclease family)
MRFIACILLFTFGVQFLPAVHAEEVISQSGSVMSGSGLIIPMNGSGAASAGSGEIVDSPEETQSGALQIPEAIVSPLLVRISEVNWAGSDLSSADEWLELAAVPVLTGSVMTHSLSLYGWTLTQAKDGGETVLAHFGLGHVIASGGFLIVSNYAAAQSRLRREPHFISNALSLPNTKLLLRLRNASGAVVDEVDDGIGAPFAGASPSGGGTKASMERVNLLGVGTDKTNWMTASTMRGLDTSANLRGTPGYANGTVEPPDITPPPPVNGLRAFSHSGSVIALWDKPIADDIAQQRIRLLSKSGSELYVRSLPGSATGVLVSSMTGAVYSLEHYSVDESGNISDGILISLQPLNKAIINEIMPDPIGPDTGEWIELINYLDEPLNLTGWVLQSGTKRFVISSAFGLLVPQQAVLLPASFTGIALPNAGGKIDLSVFGRAIDSLSYSAAEEGISFGRTESGGVIPVCSPTPGAPGVGPAPSIRIEGTVTGGMQPVTLNLQAAMSGGTLAGTRCHWDFGDGYTYDGCNPPAHSMRTAGDLTIRLEAVDYCGNTMSYSVPVFVLQKPKKEEQKTGILSCTPSSFSGLTVTELLPAPGEQEEWAELRNTSSGSLSLCGWSLDDESGGSKPYRLGEGVIEPGGYLVIHQKESRISFNNDADTLRLIAPLPGGGTGVYLSLPYQRAPKDEVFALRPDGQWLWSTYPTPGSDNRFQEVDTTLGASPVIISAVLPNPKGSDEYHEWLELENVSDRPQWLNGWHIETESGKTIDLTGIAIAEYESLRIPLWKKKITLTNTFDSVKLIDKTGNVRSLLSWKKPADGAIIERAYGSGAVEIEDVRLADDLILKGQNIKAVLEGIQLPESANIFIYENFISALIKGKKFELQNDSISDGYYAFVQGAEIAPLVLQMGYAFVLKLKRFSRLLEFEAYEREARRNLRGLWADPDIAARVDQLQSDQEMDARVAGEGLLLDIDPLSSVVESGTVMTVKTNVPAELFIRLPGKEPEAFGGSLRITDDVEFEVSARYTMRVLSGAEARTSVSLREYNLIRKHYPDCISISEVYPSPNKEESEWIELYNKCDQEVRLLGWSIDDEPDAGSKMQKIGTGMLVSPHSFKVLSGAQLRLSLNNGGDAVILRSPNGQVIDSFWYPSIAKGLSIVRYDGGLCLSTIKTPRSANSCVPKKPKAKAASKKKKGIAAFKIGLKTVYRSVLAGYSSDQLLNTNDDQGFELFEGLERKNNEKNNEFKFALHLIFFMTLIVIYCLLLGFTFRKDA